MRQLVSSLETTVNPETSLPVELGVAGSKTYSKLEPDLILPLVRRRLLLLIALIKMADDDAPVPSLTSGEIGSRFVSQTELDAANQKRDEAWKAAYARYEFITLHLC
jgi:hypothetical protein